MSDFDLERAAATMFGGTTPTAAPSRASTPPTAEEAIADKMFGATTITPRPASERASPRGDRASMAELTEEQQGQRLFHTSDPSLHHGDAMRAIESAALEQHLASPEEAKEAAQHWGEVFNSAGLSATDSAKIADLGVSVFNNPPTPELISSWVEQSQQALIQDWGPQGARAALDDARRFIDTYASRDLRDVLDATGLGSHPGVIRIIAARARAARNAGTL